MSRPLPSPWTLEDFLAWEAGQGERYEFVDGVVRMMVGGTLVHNMITLNVAGLLRADLRGSSCRVFTSDVKVVSSHTAESAYPDVVVICRSVDLSENRITEPTLIAEVLSRATADHDRGAKFELYKAVPALRYYLLVAQDQRLVDFYRRTTTGWELTRLEGQAQIEPAELACTLTLDGVYADTAC